MILQLPAPRNLLLVNGHLVFNLADRDQQNFIRCLQHHLDIVTGKSLYAEPPAINNPDPAVKEFLNRQYGKKPL